MGRYNKFGELLSEGLKKLAAAQHRSLGSVQGQLADELGYSPTAIYSWRSGHYLPDSMVVATLARIFVQAKSVDQKWMNDFLQAAEFGPVRAVEVLKQELFGISEQDIANANELNHNTNKLSDSAIEAEVSRTNSFTQLLINLQSLTSLDFLKIMGGLTVWLGGSWLVWPFFIWPLPNLSVALSTSVKYSIASLILPFLICLLQSERISTSLSLLNWKSRRKFWVLRCTAAYAGYHLILAVCLGTAVMFYSMGVWPLSPWLWHVGLALALLFTYIAAEHVSASYLVDQGSYVVSDSVGCLLYFLNGLLLIVFISFGPLIATFFYFAHAWLLQSYLGGSVLLTAIVIVSYLVIIERTNYLRSIISHSNWMAEN